MSRNSFERMVYVLRTSTTKRTQNITRHVHKDLVEFSVPSFCWLESIAICDLKTLLWFWLCSCLQAITRMTPEQQQDRTTRFRRAIDISFKRSALPDAAQNPDDVRC